MTLEERTSPMKEGTEMVRIWVSDLPDVEPKAREETIRALERRRDELMEKLKQKRLRQQIRELEKAVNAPY